MNILPSKLVNEKIMFSVDYGDVMPWNAVITLAGMTVTVVSGFDPSPHRVYAGTLTVIGTKVTYQVHGGVPGVIYKLTARAQSGGWYEREFNLAILPDNANTADLWPLTLIVTSRPYIQFHRDLVTALVAPIGGELISRIKRGSELLDDSAQVVVPSGGILKLIIAPLVIDVVSFGLVPTGGILKVPAKGDIVDNIKTTMAPSSGMLFIPPTGTENPPTVLFGLVPTGGTLA